MKKIGIGISILVLSIMFISCKKQDSVSQEVYIDDNGIIRWTENEEEVALFGANYCLPSACDYRAAGHFTSNRKLTVDQDMGHFARMGWDALRLCLWGDWENTDKHGNLIVNEHLDLMDYVIAKARERNIYMLLSPIVTYSSLWPDAMEDTTSVDGISVHYKKGELGTNADAITAQCNYWKQLLNHVNPYTGIALKDDPYILFLETINEPWHHSDDVEGSVAYINALIAAIKSTGCKKLIFHNYSQDRNIGKSIKASNIDGATFGWYPSGLNSGNTLNANYLRSVDAFPTMFNPDIKNIPRIVYEFDSPDLNNGYMYPAMMRTFKSVGAQFATMFSYDMLVSAPYNQGWNTHLMNLVYTPSKAVSTIISAKAMKHLPLYKQYGTYPENTSFGDFKVSYDEDLAVMNTAETFIYSNTTKEIPELLTSLKQIIGVGSSSVIKYSGLGSYFLDKVEDGLWRLEVYPDVLTVEDPFGFRTEPRVVIRSFQKEQQMEVTLPDLGDSFGVYPLNEGNSFSGNTETRKFTIRPGVYLLSSGDFDKNALPAKLGEIGFTEFICPSDQQLPVQVNVDVAPDNNIDQPINISAQVASPNTPNKVELVVKAQDKSSYLHFQMKQAGAYDYRAEIPAHTFTEGILEFYMEVTVDGETSKFENKNYTSNLVKSKEPMVLFNPEKDYKKLSFSRAAYNIGQELNGLVTVPNKQKAISMVLPVTLDPYMKDNTASLIITDRIKSRRDNMPHEGYLKFKAKGNCPGRAVISLVEADGTTWLNNIAVTGEWKSFSISLDDLIVGEGVILPQAFPDILNYWVTPASGRGIQGDKIQLDKVERLLISVRSLDNKTDKTDLSIEVGSIYLDFNN